MSLSLVTPHAPQPSGAPSPIAITHLWLENFRNYHRLDIEIGTRPVVLIGRNGSGKTNILEALSLFSPGRGFRKSGLRDMDNTTQGGMAWSLAVTLHKAGEAHQLGTGRDEASRLDKRIIKINGTKERQQAALCDYLSLLWLTPQMDTLFLEGNTSRRKFLDRLVYAFDPEHVTRVSAYEQSMRERNKLLAQPNADPHWLNVLEQQMAEAGVAITIARLETLERIAIAMEQCPHRFAKSILALNGSVETLLAQGTKAVDAEGQLADDMRASRGLDRAVGRAMVGPHRSRFTLIHKAKNREAAGCSTGEQKLLLLSLLIYLSNARVSHNGEAPILLLDEVVTHLDVEHKKELFDAMLGGGMQTWMTGVDAADFCGLEGVASWFNVVDGTACRMEAKG